MGQLDFWFEFGSTYSYPAAMRVESWVPEFVRRVYLANFAEDQDISDPVVLKRILEAMDQPVDRLDEAQSPESKARLRTETELAASLGIFGAPTFVVDDELFWGNDRIEAAVAFAKSAAC
jgi:2-hydroxychromene-2-carboxylate isomerase